MSFDDTKKDKALLQIKDLAAGEILYALEQHFVGGAVYHTVTAYEVRYVPRSTSFTEQGWYTMVLSPIQHPESSKDVYFHSVTGRISGFWRSEEEALQMLYASSVTRPRSVSRISAAWYIGFFFSVVLGILSLTLLR